MPTIALAVLAGAFILWRFEPTETSWLPKCILHHWTGLHCPGCGTTRALHSVLHGELLWAIKYNPLLIIGGPIIAVIIWYQRRHERLTREAIPRLSWMLFIVVTLYFVARNLPSPTTSPLAPPVNVQLEE